MPKKNSTSKIYVSLILFVSFGLCIMCANLMSSFITIGSFSFSTNNIKQNSFKIYAISIASNSSLSQATEIGKNFQSFNAAGYPWEKDGVYYVLASCYLNESDAEKVSNNLKESGTTNSIITIEFDEVSINGNFTQQEKTSILNALLGFKEVYSQLYDASVSLDTNLNNEIDTKISIGNTKSYVTKIKSSFDSVFGDKATNSLVILKIKLESLLENLDELLENEKNLSSKIKYHYFESLKLYEEVINEVNIKM